MKRGGGVARVGARYGQRYGRPRRKVVGFGEIEGGGSGEKAGRSGGRAVQHTGCCTQLDNNKLKKEQRALF